MEYSEALAFLCGPFFLQVHPVFPDVTKTLTITEGTSAQEYLQAFWSTENTHWFTIYKHSEPPYLTLMYSHMDDTMYYAQSHMHMHDEMPPGYAFLAQTTNDNDSEPRLLILDIVFPVIHDPVVRNNRLRGLARFFSPCCHVHWVGHIESLKHFLDANKHTLPHKVDKIMVQTNDPLHIHVYKT